MLGSIRYMYNKMSMRIVHTGNPAVRKFKSHIKIVRKFKAVNINDIFYKYPLTYFQKTTGFLQFSLNSAHVNITP
jgi:hypothetical protein